MSVVLDAVLPVFLLAALGFLLYQIRFINREVSKGLNQLVYWIGLPALLFHKISQQELEWSSVANVLIAFFAALAATIAISYLVGRLLKISKDSTGAFVQASYRGNLGFIGLPIILYSATAENLERSEAIAAISLAPCAIVFNIIAVALMLIHQPKNEASQPKVLFSFLTNPLIIGGSLGVLASLSKVELPLFMERSFAELSNMSVPVALIGLGSSFGVFGARGFDRLLVSTIAGATVIKVLISPILGVIVALLLGLDAVEARIVIIYLATPTAIASHVIVGQFQGNEKLAAASIVSATIASIFSLTVGLLITNDSTWARLLAWT